METLLTGFWGIVIVLALLILAAVWIILPFVVVGINSRVDALLKEPRRSNELLATIVAADPENRGPRRRARSRPSNGRSPKWWG